MEDLRIGQGFDAHRLAPGRRLVLAGVVIPFERGLLGHSDADVVAHAIMDAILGALAAGDLGQHFPPGDPEYKGADSMGLLGRVVEMAGARGYRVAQLDATVLAEAPKLRPYIQAMRENLAAVSKAELGAVSVKATTTDTLGCIGRGEGIAALAIVMLVPK